ncbi:hypothetical protein B0H17DRAFT_1132198 [Mycena rosella]|uniref:Uncharacterized protein n=1 Tax=Mycena rosella TaxID=1033263 RepID=A0AAD7GM56_MYCRO|nr:hypothetical protein B0H17DRAFT_1132198 [Mycena rosella]
MPRLKSTLTDDEVRDRRAETAWRYRQGHRETTNAAARLRMQNPAPAAADPVRRREKLQTVPSAVQQEALAQAKRYRHNYMVTKEALVRSAIKSSASAQAPSTKKKPTRKTMPLAIAPSAAPALPYPPLPATKAVAPAQRSPTPSPRSLAAIQASNSDEDLRDEEEEEGWEADNEREELGPLLNPTGNPGYIPLTGQQPYFKAGRRYWI